MIQQTEVNSSHRLIGLGQSYAAERVGKMFGEMLPIRRLNSRQPLIRLAQRKKQVESNCVQSSKIHNHFSKGEIGIRWQEIHSPDSTSPKRALNVRRFKRSLIDQLLGVKHFGHTDCRRFQVGQITSLSKDDDPTKVVVNLDGNLRLKAEVFNMKNWTSGDQVALVERFVRGREGIDHSKSSRGIIGGSGIGNRPSRALTVLAFGEGGTFRTRSTISHSSGMIGGSMRNGERDAGFGAIGSIAAESLGSTRLTVLPVCTVTCTVSCSASGKGSRNFRTPPSYVASTVINIAHVPANGVTGHFHCTDSLYLSPTATCSATNQKGTKFHYRREYHDGILVLNTEMNCSHRLVGLTQPDAAERIEKELCEIHPVDGSSNSFRSHRPVACNSSYTVEVRVIACNVRQAIRMHDRYDQSIIRKQASLWAYTIGSVNQTLVDGKDLKSKLGNLLNRSSKANELLPRRAAPWLPATLTHKASPIHQQVRV